jgi:hypothetical protein
MWELREVGVKGGGSWRARTLGIFTIKVCESLEYYKAEGN